MCLIERLIANFSCRFTGKTYNKIIYKHISKVDRSYLNDLLGEVVGLLGLDHGSAYRRWLEYLRIVLISCSKSDFFLRSLTPAD